MDVLLSQICTMFFSFFQIYIFCQLGEMVSGKFMDLSETIYQLEWYNFPPEIQRILIILLINTEEPVEFVAYGNIVCSCETYKKVIFLIVSLEPGMVMSFISFDLQVVNVGYSYFSIFRRSIV